MKEAEKRGGKRRGLQRRFSNQCSLEGAGTRQQKALLVRGIRVPAVFAFGTALPLAVLPRVYLATSWVCRSEPCVLGRPRVPDK